MIISPNDECFQLGRQLYDAQVLYSQIEKGDLDKDRILTTIKQFCKLINCTGQLREECNRIYEVVNKAKIQLDTLVKILDKVE